MSHSSPEHQHLLLYLNLTYSCHLHNSPEPQQKTEALQLAIASCVRSHFEPCFLVLKLLKKIFVIFCLVFQKDCMVYITKAKCAEVSISKIRVRTTFLHSFAGLQGNNTSKA